MEKANGYMEIRETEELISLKNSSSGQLPGLKHPKWWQVLLFITCLLVGQPASALLTNFYYEDGGNNIWIATILQSAGFPILIPVFLLRKFMNPTSTHNDDSPRNTPSKAKWIPFLLYLIFGFFYALDNIMYAFGLLYLPVSTYSLICASLLAFNAIFTFIINCHKFTIFTIISILLLTASASLLAVDPDSDDSQGTAKEEDNYIKGIVFTVCASALSSLLSSLLEKVFKDVFNKPPFDAALEILFCQCCVTTCLTVSGLFVWGEWKTLPEEMLSFEKGWMAYVIILLCISVSYQIAFFGTFGLTFEVSSLFANMVYTFSLPIVPVLGVVIFHDKVDVVKVIAFGLAIGGSLSYIYHLHLDDVKSRDSLVSCEDLSA